MKLHRLLFQITCIGALALSFGCGDEGSPNLPTILAQNSSAICRDDNGTSKLDSIEVAVLDFDGAENLGAARVRVLSSILTMEKEPAAYEPALNEAGNPVGPVCGLPDQLCVAVYTWRRRSDLEQIFCSDDEPLTVSFEVSDEDGNRVDAILIASPPAD